MKIVVVGGGVAASEAVQSARRSSPDAEIIMLSAESVLPYRRPALSRMVAEEVSDVQFYLRDAAFYAAQNIAVLPGVTVAAVDLDKHRLRTGSGETVTYDKLILAVGSRGFVPPLAGYNQYPPQLLRTYADLLAIRSRLDAGVKSAVIVGGGLLGLELADALLKRGVKVSVVESFPRLLPRQLDPDGAEFFRSAVESRYPLEFFLGDAPESYCDEGVKLSSGRLVTGELVLAAAGVRGRTELASSCGLSCGKGICVDGSMRTSDRDVYAAGDCVEFAGRTFGLFIPARDMGRVAGACAAGGEAVFTPDAAESAVRWQGLGVRLNCRGGFSGTGTGGASPDGCSYSMTFPDGEIKLQVLP